MRGKRGISLVEVTVALAILSSVMLSLYGVGINVLNHLTTSKIQAQATALSQQGLEIAVNSAKSCSKSNGDYIANTTNNTLASTVGPTALGGNFFRQITISDPAASEVSGSAADYKKITVTVTWGSPAEATSRVYGIIGK